MDQKDKRNEQEIGVKPAEMLTDEELNQVAGGCGEQPAADDSYALAAG